MTAMTRILVPTDFSATSREAFVYAKTLAAQFDASLHLVHAFEDPFTAATFAEVYAPLPAGLRESMLRDIEKRLAVWMPRADRARFRGTTEIATGAAAPVMVDRAKALGVDLIVMGTHGRGGVTHLMLGSVAERPVLTARYVAPKRERPELEYDVEHLPAEDRLHGV